MASMRGGLQAAGALAAALCLAAAGPAAPQNASPAAPQNLDGLGRAEAARGARALDGASFALQSGAVVRLAGLNIPPVEAPFAENARAALDALVRDRDVTLRAAGDRRDRRGRTVAHVWTDSGDWVQGALLSAGLARVETAPGAAELAVDMLAAEQAARAAGRGLWADPDWSVMGPDPYALAQRLDTFQIVEGIVVETAETRDFAYLNFGLDYRTDFTVSIRLRDLDDLREERLDPMALAGARIRVRGYVHAVNGPMIDLDHAAQIEILD